MDNRPIGFLDSGVGGLTVVRELKRQLPHESIVYIGDSARAPYGPRPAGQIREYTWQLVKFLLTKDVKMIVIACNTATAVVWEEIKEALRIFEVEHLIDRQVCNLSGGQLQRVLLSMAVMDEPNLLLLDEPVSGIDQNGMELFYRTMDYLKKNFDLAIILISHDLDYVAKYADKVLLLDKTILKQGTPKEVYASKEFGRIFGMEGRV